MKETQPAMEGDRMGERPSISTDSTSRPSISSLSTSSDEDRFRSRVTSGVLERIIDEDFQTSARNYNSDPKIDKKCLELSNYLQKRAAEFESNQSRFYTRGVSITGRLREVLEVLSPRYNEKYRSLLKRFLEWKPKREAFIESLSRYIEELDRNTKVSTIARLVSSSVDVSGTLAGIIYSESTWAGHAFNVASVCGLCGLFSTVAEVDRSKRILDEVSESVDEDYKRLQKIVTWFEEIEDLDSVVQELFPHGIDTEVVQQIQAASTEQENYLKVFKAALLSNVRRDSQLWMDKDFLHSLQLFSTSEVAHMWWNRIVYRKHPIELDLGRMALQMEFGQLQSIIFQCIPALPLEQQRLSSLPVAGRIMLNLLTMYDSFHDLNKGAKSKHSDKLRRLLEKKKEEFEMIEDTVRMMRPRRE